MNKGKVLIAAFLVLAIGAFLYVLREGTSHYPRVHGLDELIERLGDRERIKTAHRGAEDYHYYLIYLESSIDNKENSSFWTDKRRTEVFLILLRNCLETLATYEGKDASLKFETMRTMLLLCPEMAVDFIANRTKSTENPKLRDIAKYYAEQICEGKYIYKDYIIITESMRQKLKDALEAAEKTDAQKK